MFGKRLREVRLARHVTQQKLADTVGIALRSYQCYEQGTREPPLDMLLKLADALDVSVDYLMGRSETPTVAVACAIPAEFHGAVLKELEKIGISKEQIVTESPRAAVVGDGFIIDFVSPKEAMDISGLLMRIISNCSPDLSKSSDGSP